VSLSTCIDQGSGCIIKLSTYILAIARTTAQS
jgi:hypothetical protein